MSLTGNFILWNNKAKPQKYEAHCSDTTSVRNGEVKQLLWRLASVPDRSHRGWKVTFSPVQKRSFKSCAQRQLEGLTQDCETNPGAKPSSLCTVVFSSVRDSDLQHPRQVPPPAPLFWESRHLAWGHLRWPPLGRGPLGSGVKFLFSFQLRIYESGTSSVWMESQWEISPKGFSEGLDATYFWVRWEYHKSKLSYNVSLLSPADSEKHTGMCKLNTDII